MKTKIILLWVFLLMGFSAVYTQTDSNEGLVLRGRYSEWKKIELDIADGELIEYYNYFERFYFRFNDEKITKKDILWVAELRMEFVNKGKKTIILVAPKQDFGELKTKVILSSQTAVDSEENTGSDLLKEITRKSKGMSAKEIDTDKPPENIAVIIEPGDSWHFNDRLDIFQKPGIDKPISSHKIIKLEYELSFLHSHKDTEFLEKLQARWQKYGYLPVSENGEFSIMSELLVR